MTTDSKEKVLNEMQIKKLIQEEIAECFKSLVEAQEEQGKAIEEQGTDIKEIKEALLGGNNKYKKQKGLADMIQFSYDFAKSNIDNKFNDRTLIAVEHYEDWAEGKEGFTKWDLLQQVIEDFVFSKRMKLFFGIGSWAGIVSLVMSLGGIIGFIVYLVNIGVIQ